MRKICCLLIALLISIPSAVGAVTVKEFCSAYNERMGKGFDANTSLYDPSANNIWFLISQYAGSFVAVQFDPESASDPAECEIKTIFVRHKPRTSMGQFVACANTAMSIIYPDIDSATIAETISSAMARSWYLFGEEPRDAIAYNTELFGQLVYQESIEYDTLLVNAPEE